MKISDLTKEQAEFLDGIVNKCFQGYDLTIDDLPSAGNERMTKDNRDVKRNEYQSYIDLLASEGVLDILETNDQVYFKSLPVETESFVRKGGFKGLLVKEIEQKELKSLEEERLRTDVEKLKKELDLTSRKLNDYDKTKRRSKWSMVFAIVGLLTSMVLAAKELFC